MLSSSCRSRKMPKKSDSGVHYKPKKTKKRKNISPIKVSEQISSAKVNTSQPGEQLLNEQWKSNVSPETNQGQNKFSFLKGGLAELIAFKCMNIHIYNQKVAEKKKICRT